MLIKEYYLVDEIIKWKLTTLTKRMINLRVKKFKNKYPEFIRGGNQGRRYEIHYSLLLELTKRKNQSSRQIIKKEEEEINKRVADIFFENTDWTYFFMINPENKQLDYKTILNLIPQSSYSYLFYSDHYSPNQFNENIHTHIILKTNLSIDQFTRELKKNIGIRTAPIRPVPYRKELSKSCFSYFTQNRNEMYNKPAQRNYHFGILMGTR
jgi:hypothetical protein